MIRRSAHSTIHAGVAESGAKRGRRASQAAVVAVVALAALSWLPSGAIAQDWPNRPVRIIVGQTPGAPPDFLARTIAEPLAQLWGQPVVVENRSGAGGMIAAELVAKASPDGYTLLLGGQSNLAGAAALDPSRRYEPLTDFVPIGRIAHVPVFIVVNAAVPVRTMRELVAEARNRPGRLTFVSYGDASISRMTFRLLMTVTGVELLEIPYKGVAPSIADLLAGRVDMGLFDLATVRQHVAAGTLRLVAATGAIRAKAAPDVATVAEQGVTGIDIGLWYGLVAPAGTPADARAHLADALDTVRRQPGVQRRIEQLDYESMFDDPAQFAAAIRSDIDTFSRAMKRLGN